MDAQLFENSLPSMRSSLDIFSKIPTDVSVLATDYLQIWPNTSIKENNPVEICIPQMNNAYLDLFNSFLLVRSHITNDNGTPLTTNQIVAPSNLFLHSMFETVQLYVCGLPVSPETNYYPYAAYLQTLLGTTSLEKTTFLGNELYYKDTKPDVMNVLTNDSFKTRVNIARESRIFEMIGKPRLNLFQQTRYLPPNIDLRLVLKKSSPEFCLQGVEAPTTATPFTYKVHLDEVVFYLRKHTINPAVQQWHESLFAKGMKAQIPCRSSQVKVFNINPGSLTFVTQSVWTGPAPEFIVVGLVSGLALNGDYKLNSFGFQHFDVSNIQCTLDGDSVVSKGFNFDFDKKLYLTAYKALCDINGGTTNSISREDFLNGHTLFCFNLLPYNQGNRLQIERHGQIKLHITFKKAVAATISAIVLGSFSHLLSIDSNRNISVESTTAVPLMQ